MKQGLVVVPVHNEENAIGGVVEALSAVPEGCSVVFINDGSRDGSAAVLRGLGCDVVSHPVNLGYTEALQTGIAVALGDGYDFVVFFDGDGQHRVEDLRGVIAFYRANASDVDVVVGSRILAGGGAASGLRRFGSGLLFLFARALTGLTVRDVTSGMKLLSVRAMRTMQRAALEDGHAELLAFFRVMGLNVGEVPITVEERRFGVSMYNALKTIAYPLRTAYLIVAAVLLRGTQGRMDR